MLILENQLFVEEENNVMKVSFIFSGVICMFQNIQKSEKSEPNEMVLNLLVSSIVLGYTIFQ